MGFTLGVILARGGSKGIPRKNLFMLCGKPLVDYTIEAAIRAERLDRVVLSTDDKEIAAVAIQKGVEVIIRPAKISGDKAPMELALRHAVAKIEREIKKVDYVIALYANVPIRREDIIDQAICKLISSDADSLQTYTPYRTPPQWAYIIKGDRPIPLKDYHTPSYRRQDLIPAYHPDGAVVAVRRDVLMNSSGVTAGTSSFLGADRRAILQFPEDTVDVDEPIDLLWAEFLLERKQKL